MSRVAQPLLTVAGVADGAEVVRFRLAHGELPDAGLRTRGWEPRRPAGVAGSRDPHAVTITYDVAPLDGEPPAPPPVPRDPGLVVADGEQAAPYQRLAAYAVVLSERGVLLSRFAGSTNAEGEWGLVGGGVDPGELPEDAVHREVWEESGQRVEVTGLATVTSSHWVGRAPNGRLEDFHAVRIAYWADGIDASDPVVHDVGGTTAESRWVPLTGLSQVPLVTSWRAELPRLLTARGLVVG